MLRQAAWFEKGDIKILNENCYLSTRTKIGQASWEVCGDPAFLQITSRKVKLWFSSSPYCIKDFWVSHLKQQYRTNTNILHRRFYPISFISFISCNQRGQCTVDLPMGGKKMEILKYILSTIMQISFELPKHFRSVAFNDMI